MSRYRRWVYKRQKSAQLWIRLKHILLHEILWSLLRYLYSRRVHKVHELMYLVPSRFPYSVFLLFSYPAFSMPAILLIAFSCRIFSTPAKWLCIFLSRDFMSCVFNVRVKCRHLKSSLSSIGLCRYDSDDDNCVRCWCNCHGHSLAGLELCKDTFKNVFIICSCF